MPTWRSVVLAAATAFAWIAAVSATGAQGYPTRPITLVIPLPPGQYHLHVHVPYLIPTQVGKADLPINVGGGRPIELEYKAPLWAFSPGSLGTPPQKYNGVLATVLIMVIPLAILLICCCGSFLTSLSRNS